jgi:hypothetical protein
LTITQAGSFELAHAFPGGVGIGEVVVAELLALQLGEGRERARHRPQVAVERGLLVRVLAVAQVHHLDEVAVVLCREQRQRAIVLDRRQVVADEGVVLGDAVEGGHRQREARLRRQRAVVRRRVRRAAGGYCAGSVATATWAKFFAAARSIAGPPMSMFSTMSSNVLAGSAATRSNGYRFSTSRSIGRMPCSQPSPHRRRRGARAGRHAPSGAGS